MADQHQYGYDQPTDAGYMRSAPAPTAVQLPPQSHVIAMNTVEMAEPWAWCTVVTAVFGYFCCQPFGTISVIMGLLAYTDHKVKDFGRSRSKKNMALGFGIAAIVIGSLIWLIVIIAVAVAGAATANAVDGYRRG